MSEIKRQKKVVDFSYCDLRFSTTYVPNKKSPRYTRGRFPLIFMAHDLKLSRFQITKNKQKRFFMSLKFNFAQTTIFYILFTTF